MANITAANVAVGHTIQGDYTEGIVRERNEHGIEVQWCDGGGDFLTWEQVAEEGFTFN